jgi:hypothetical protein
LNAASAADPVTNDSHRSADVPPSVLDLLDYVVTSHSISIILLMQSSGK